MKIFRNYRLNAITSQKVRNYTWYALGETVLVVFGILIALQINTWNEDRISQIKLQAYYERLTADLHSNIADFEFLIRMNNNRLDSIPVFLQLLHRKKPLHEVKKLISMRLFAPRTTNPTRNTFEDLKNTGNFNLIKNVTLKAQLTHYYDDLVAKQKVIDKLDDSIVETTSYSSLRQKLTTYYETIYQNQPAAKLDWQWLNDADNIQFRQLEERILTIADVRGTEVFLLRNLKMNAEKTIEAIQTLKNK